MSNSRLSLSLVLTWVAAPALAILLGVGAAAWMGSRMVREGIQVLTAMGVPTYKTPAKAVQAFLHLVSYARNLTILHETPRDLPLEFVVVGFSSDDARLMATGRVALTGPFEEREAFFDRRARRL